MAPQSKRIRGVAVAALAAMTVISLLPGVASAQTRGGDDANRRAPQSRPDNRSGNRPDDRRDGARADRRDDARNDSRRGSRPDDRRDDRRDDRGRWSAPVERRDDREDRWRGERRDDDWRGDAGWRGDGWRDTEEVRVQESKNDWRNLAIAAGGVAVYGALKGDPYIGFGGLAGALYSLDRYEEDRRSQGAMERTRYSFFSQPYFYREGVRYERREVSRDGRRYYQFVRG